MRRASGPSGLVSTTLCASQHPSAVSSRMRLVLSKGARELYWHDNTSVQCTFPFLFSPRVATATARFLELFGGRDACVPNCSTLCVLQPPVLTRVSSSWRNIVDICFKVNYISSRAQIHAWMNGYIFTCHSLQNTHAEIRFPRYQQTQQLCDDVTL